MSKMCSDLSWQVKAAVVAVAAAVVTLEVRKVTQLTMLTCILLTRCRLGVPPLWELPAR